MYILNFITNLALQYSLYYIFAHIIYYTLPQYDFWLIFWILIAVVKISDLKIVVPNYNNYKK